MTTTRSASLLFFGSLLGLLVPSCFTIGDDDSGASCKPGAKGCECKRDDVCNTGLTCDAKGHCVEHGAAGQGGSAGTSQGKTSSGGSGGFNPYARAGAHSGGKGGAPNQGGSGGTVGESGQGGEAATSGEGGASHVGGSGGSGAQGGSGGKGGSGGGGGKGGLGGMAGSGGCTAITLSDLFVEYYFYPNQMEFSASSTPDLGDVDYPDEVFLDVYTLYNGVDLGGDKVGMFELGTGDDVNLDKCGRCLGLKQDISGAGQRYFFASEGTLTFTSDSKQMKGYPHGTLRNVTLREATYDENTYHSTFVTNGACVTIANADLLVNVDPPVTGWDNCPAPWYGDGSVCDCGCGAFDTNDCTSQDVSACAECYCSSSIDDCTAVSPSENGVCL